MSIRPPSDIVLDVARAADPQLYKAAAAKLDAANIASAFAPAEIAGQFAAVFDRVNVDATEPQEIVTPEYTLPVTQMPFDAASALTRLKNDTALGGAANITSAPAATAYRNFEAMVLTSFVETMLPQSSAATFGSGSAGQIWRSMLAQQIAAQLAESGGVGIAERLAASEAAKTSAQPDTTS